MRPRRTERGSASLEVVGLLPMVLFCALVAVQFGIAGWTMVETQQAARSAARAAVKGEDPHAAARGALPGSLAPSQVVGQRTPDGQRWTVTVDVPSLLYIDLGSVTRTVEMPEVK